MTGLALSGAGAVAVFVTNNQAGSVALILGGIVFLLMLISGNPLLSLGHGETQMRFATRRSRVIREAEEAPPREARSALEALSTIDPRVARDSSFIRTSELVYERLVRAELVRLFPEFSIREERRDGLVDIEMIADTPDHRAIFFEVRSSQSPVPSTAVRQINGMASEGFMGGILVAHQRLTRPAGMLLRKSQEGGSKIAFVQWRDEDDSDALKNAVLGLLGETG
ncbi:restriction endonuclease [Streptomyces sp. NPDC059900]|uniref:restriction endonuclease n=1 Tax=Streptomyces sp. NPDC059900 TaxID=3155816 RepID=UPI00344406BC